MVTELLDGAGVLPPLHAARAATIGATNTSLLWNRTMIDTFPKRDQSPTESDAQHSPR